MDEDVRVLHVDDDPSITEISERALPRADESLEVLTATSAEDGLERIRTERVDCVVSDYQMPGTDGFEFLRTVREEFPDLPFILFTGKGSEEIASEAISAGVTDYLQKKPGSAQFELLANRIANAVRQYRAESGPAANDTQRDAVMSDLVDLYAAVEERDGVRVLADCSGSLAAHLEYDRDNLVGRPLADFVADAEPGEIDAWEGGDGSGPDSWSETTLLTAGGEERPMRFRTTTRIGDDGTREGTLTMFVDDAERAALAEEAEFLKEVMNTVPDAIYALDEDMEYYFVNEGMAELTGYPREEIIGSHKSMVNTDESVKSGAVKRQDLHENEREGMKVALHPHITADGEQIPTEVRFRALPTGDDDEFRGTAGVVRDVTNRIERQRELERQNRRLDEFASVVSHDLRNPLNIVEGRVELARLDCECDEADEHLQTAKTELGRMDEIIEDVLSFARHGEEVTEYDRVDLRTIAEAAWDSVSEETATLEVEHDLTFKANELRTRRLFENLLRNAVEHVGADVTVRVGSLRDGFYLEDGGPGIPEEKADEIFDAGVTTAQDGTGFGLAIVKTIVETHGWHVDIVDADDGGARFEITGIDLLDDEVVGEIESGA